MKKLLIYYFVLIFLNVFDVNAQTWSNGVGKIFQQNCVKCHSPSGGAPFSLRTYNEVLPYGNMIGSAVNAGHMPPWTPDPSYKEFAHQRVLEPTDKTKILDWINNGMPIGNPNEVPTVAVFPSGSQLGTPNLSLTIPTYTVSSNNDVYYNFVLPSGLTQEMYANAIEVLPGNGNIVHHVLIYEDASTNPINPTSMGGTGSNASNLLYGFTPGAQPYFTPPGSGFRLPANTRIIMQVHYAPGSLGQTDQTTVNFKLTSIPQRRVFVTPLLNHSNISNGPLFIPANQTKTFNSNFTVPLNATFLYVFPHMHLIGTSIKSWGTNAGNTIKFIDIPHWDFHWQDNFIFPNTINVPAGTILNAEAFYNNTTTNSHNPSNPPLNVSAGEGTYDEMFLVFFAYMLRQPGDENIIIDKRIIPKGATTVCHGESVSLTAIKGVGYTYQWYKNGIPIPGATNSSYEAFESGSYTLNINLGPNSTLSDPVNVTINPLPYVSIAPPASTIIPSGGSISLAATNNPLFTYQWYFNGSLITGATSSTIVATQAGEYRVLVNNGCYSFSNTISLQTQLGLNEINNNRFIVYPNPAQSVLNIIDTNKLNSEYEILNILGQKIVKGNLIGFKSTIDIQALESGTYFLNIKNNNEETTRIKFVVR